jgi:hypothetical protein
MTSDYFSASLFPLGLSHIDGFSSCLVEYDAVSKMTGAKGSAMTGMDTQISAPRQV